MRKVGYAIIGFGGIAENRIAKEGFGIDSSRFAGHPNAMLLGVTDANASRKEAASRLGLRWYDSVDALLDDPQVEAVFIATNNRSHAPLAQKAMEAGKHCLVEKPIATMVENAYNQRTRDLVAAGAIGNVNDICLHMEFCYGAAPDEAATWRCADPSEIGGPLGDVGSHCLYMAEFLLNGTVKSLSCVYAPRTLEIVVENGAFVQFRLDSGIQGTVRVAFNQPRGGLGGTLTNLGYEIYGAMGVIRSYGTLFQLSGHPGEPVPIRLELDRFTNTETVKVDRVGNIYQAVIGRHAQSILDDRPLDAGAALHNLALVLGCHESAGRQGRLLEF